MNAQLARTIITQALNDETWEGDIPEDDDKAIEEAGDVVKMAEDAWEQGVKGPEVEAILKLAASAEDDDEPAPKAKAKGGRPKPAAAAAPEPAAVDVSEPWDDYLENSVAEVKEGIEAWAQQEEWESLLNLMAFEEANKNRVNVVKAVLKLVPEDQLPSDDEPVADPEPEPDDEPEADPVNEPYEGYNDLTLKEVKDSLNEFLEGEGSEDVSSEDKLETLKQVIDYEAVTGARAGLLKYLNEKMSLYSEQVPAEEDAPVEEIITPPKKARGKAAAVKSDPDGQSYTVTYTGADEMDYSIAATGGQFAVAGLVADLLGNGAVSVRVDAT